MPLKFDPLQVVDVFVHVTGGEVGATSSLAPKIGPLRLSPKKISKDIAKRLQRTGRASTWRWSSPFRIIRRRWWCCLPPPRLSLKRSKSPRGTWKRTRTWSTMETSLWKTWLRSRGWWGRAPWRKIFDIQISFVILQVSNRNLTWNLRASFVL